VHGCLHFSQRHSLHHAPTAEFRAEFPCSDSPCSYAHTHAFRLTGSKLLCPPRKRAKRLGACCCESRQTHLPCKETLLHLSTTCGLGGLQSCIIGLQMRMHPSLRVASCMPTHTLSRALLCALPPHTQSSALPCALQGWPAASSLATTLGVSLHVCVGFVCLRSPLYGLVPPFALLPARVAVVGWYPWSVICSHVCALANERPARRLCACVSPPTITGLGCVMRVLFCVCVSTLTRPLHFLPPRRWRTERYSTRPHDGAPIHA
jgi:hypothetical protein